MEKLHQGFRVSEWIGPQKLFIIAPKPWSHEHQSVHHRSANRITNLVYSSEINLHWERLTPITDVMPFVYHSLGQSFKAKPCGISGFPSSHCSTAPRQLPCSRPTSGICTAAVGFCHDLDLGTMSLFVLTRTFSSAGFWER